MFHGKRILLRPALRDYAGQVAPAYAKRLLRVNIADNTMKVKDKVWVDSYGAEIILFIKISGLTKNGKNLTDCILLE